MRPGGETFLGLALAALALAATLGTPAGARAASTPCTQLSPSAAPCIFAGKVADSAAAECRRLGRPESDCALPLSHAVSGAIRDAYLKSWLHRTAGFQYALGDSLGLGRVQWLGTHNSFNSLSDSETISHSDSNQQLSLSQQLDIDIRALELDLHYLPNSNAGGQNAVVVCHGRGPDEANAGCTNERLFSQVLPEVADWLNAPAHRREVVLLYLEDELGSAAGFTETVRQLDRIMRRSDGSSLLYRPASGDMTTKGCANLPLGTSRDDVRARGAQVVLVGNCRRGWSADVFGWNDVHVESGSTPRYRAFPACDATYARSVYDSKLVRYYEDSTFVSGAIAPTDSPKDKEADSLTPEKVAAMTRCGVNLFGFDQLLPDDGRIEATIWSWARDKPVAADGACAVQRADGRWLTRPCMRRRRAACRTRAGWAITRPAVTFAAAPAACRSLDATPALPRTGYENSRLRQAAASSEVWLDYRTDVGLPPGLLCRAASRRVTCRISAARASRAGAQLMSGARVVARARAVLHGGAGELVFRPRRLGSGRYEVRATIGAARLRRGVVVR